MLTFDSWAVTIGGCCWFLVVGSKLLGVGCCLSVVVVGSWLSGDSCWALAVACRWLLLVPGCRVSVVGRWLLFVGVGCWLVDHDFRGWCPVAKFKDPECGI
jgi:hypothetical protein